MVSSPQTVSPWIKIAVLLHCFAILVWTLPNVTHKPVGSDHILMFNSRLKESVIGDYMMTTGFWQYWDMFAPDPSNLDIFADAEVTYRDGSTKFHQYPRMKKLSLPMRYLKERYRKFYERVNMEANQYLWPVVAQRIALEEFQDPQNPPVRVKLSRHWRIVQPPNKPPETKYRTYMYFDYLVDQNLLRSQAN